MTSQDVNRTAGKIVPEAIKKGVPMNTRHNYFPLEVLRRLGSANLLLFLLFLGCFFLGCHELNASLRRFSCFGARSHFFEAQRIVPLDAYTQDIEVLLLQCQQKNAGIIPLTQKEYRGTLELSRGNYDADRRKRKVQNRRGLLELP